MLMAFENGQTEIEGEFLYLAKICICRGQSWLWSNHVVGTEKFELMCDHEKSNIKMWDDVCEAECGDMDHI